MKTLLTACILLFSTINVYSDQVDKCLSCHKDVEDDTGPSHKISRDVHFQKGLGCVDCHGGDAALDDMDLVRNVKGYRGKPSHLEVPEFCARCHSDAAYMHNHNPSLPTDQLEKYKTSVHGQRLFGAKDAKVANCISCHSVHEISNARIPHSSTYPMNIPRTCGKCHADAAYMAEYRIPTNQLEEYLKSVHGKTLLEKKDLGAPACNSCHGNHGAAPPGVASLSAVCGNCHAVQAELFNASPHEKAFTDNKYPMCETCHSNHNIASPGDTLIGTTEPALCINCHQADDGTKGFATATSISTAIGALVKSRDSAAVLLADATTKGMLTTDEELRLKEVDQALIQARTLIHSFDVAKVSTGVQSGQVKADTVRTNAAALIDEYYYRRKGLGVATLFITLLAVSLYLKIRRLE